MDFFSQYGGADDDIEGDSSLVTIPAHKEEPEIIGLVGYGYDYKEVCFYFFVFFYRYISFFWSLFVLTLVNPGLLASYALVEGSER